MCDLPVSVPVTEPDMSRPLPRLGVGECLGLQWVSVRVTEACAASWTVHMVGARNNVACCSPSPPLLAGMVRWSPDSRFLCTVNANMPRAAWIWDLSQGCLMAVMIHMQVGLRAGLAWEGLRGPWMGEHAGLAWEGKR